MSEPLLSGSPAVSAPSVQGIGKLIENIRLRRLECEFAAAAVSSASNSAVEAPRRKKKQAADAAFDVALNELVAALRPAEPTEERPLRGIWSCKIGECGHDTLPDGADAPMRQAVQRAYVALTGKDPQFTFSGWGASLTPGQRQIVNEEVGSGERLPKEDKP